MQFNASLLNKSIHFYIKKLKKTFHRINPKTWISSVLFYKQFTQKFVVLAFHK